MPDQKESSFDLSIFDQTAYFEKTLAKPGRDLCENWI